MRARRLRLVRLGALGLVLVCSLVSGVLFYDWWTQIAAVPDASCHVTVPLTARTEPGAPWQQHRHQLLPADSPLPAGLSYLVWNQRTDQMFRWVHDTNAAGEPRILVPTRYAALHNRGWDDDSWRYCLVLAPTPPFQVRKRGFTTQAKVDTPLTQPGAGVSIAATVTADRRTQVLVDVEVSDPKGARVAQWVYADEDLHARDAVTYPIVWQVPADAQPGIYTIRVGVFRPRWAGLLHWNAGTAVIAVR